MIQDNKTLSLTAWKLCSNDDKMYLDQNMNNTFHKNMYKLKALLKTEYFCYGMETLFSSREQ